MVDMRRHLQSIPMELVNEAAAFTGKVFQAGYDDALGQCVVALAGAQAAFERLNTEHPELAVLGKEYELIKDLLWGAPK